MRIVTSDEVDAALSFPALIDALAAAFRLESDLPVRHHHEIGTGERPAVQLLMPAWTPGAPGEGHYLGTKIVSAFPDNRSHGLPAILGVYVLQSGETGAPLAVIDGTRLTHWRTAAASALAARYLARPDARRLLMVGAGALAPFLVRAHATVRPIEHVSVWNHRVAGTEALVDQLRREGISADAALDLEAAVASADIVSCATLSREPLIRGAWLHPGIHLDLVGAFSMTMREVDDDALRGARLFVDTPAAMHEGGDVAIAIAAGAITAADVVANLHDLCRQTAAGRGSSDEITLFKSAGTAIEDLAAAMLIWQKVQSAF